MFSWFKKDRTLQEALVRSYESTIGFLKTQLEYEQSKNDDLLKLIHTQAGLIKDKETISGGFDLRESIQTGRSNWSQTRKELENQYVSNPKTKEIQDYIKDNESVIVGDYDPNNSERSN